MSSFDVVATVSRLADADPATCDRDGLAELVTMSQRARAWLDALDVRIAVHARRLAESGACEAPEALLTGGGRRAAREEDGAAMTCMSLLRSGVVTYCLHGKVITRRLAGPRSDGFRRRPTRFVRNRALPAFKISEMSQT